MNDASPPPKTLKAPPAHHGSRRCDRLNAVVCAGGSAVFWVQARRNIGPVAQGIEQQPSKLTVRGSNPLGVAMFIVIPFVFKVLDEVCRFSASRFVSRLFTVRPRAALCEKDNDQRAA